MNMQMRKTHLFVWVALVLQIQLTLAQYQWSGFVNSLLSSFDYQCPDDLVITGLASIFDDPVNDRRWEFSCGSGGNVANVTSTCTLQSPVHEIRKDIDDYECPNNGYIAGFQTTYSGPNEDRLWSPYCCTRNYSTLTNCHILTANWENVLEGTLNWTASSDRVLTGMTSFFSTFNRDRRWRFKQCEVQVPVKWQNLLDTNGCTSVSCGDPGIPLNGVRDGESFLYQDVVVFTCNHGYYMSSGDSRRVCQDTGLWSGLQPACTLCTDIENCIDIRCTSDSDQYCYECASNRGVALGESGFRNLNTSCEPYCSWLGGFCYPGVCPLGPSSCNCSDGFSGPDCLNIYEQPELESCTLTITSPSSLITTCGINSNITSYINYSPNELTGQWSALYRGPFPYPQLPAYVGGYGVGIVRSWIEASLYRQDSYPSTPASTTVHVCDQPLSPNNPFSSLLTCTSSVTDLTNHTFLHGDRFQLEVLIENGGYLNITDLDSNDTTTHHYNGTPITPFSLIVIDTHPPVHCSVVPTIVCTVNQDTPLRTSLVHDDLTLSWGGWSDSPAGIIKYTLEIYKLIYNPSEEVLEKADSFLYTAEFTDDSSDTYTSEEFSLSDEGPYSLILISTDRANNRQYARRIIVYDDTSQLMENSSHPLTVIGGFKDTLSNGYWHNSTTTPIRVNGRGHFYNTNFRTVNWLAPVANHTPSVPPIYDTEDRFGVPNALGITRLSFNFIIDQVGGASPSAITRPVSFPHRVNDLSLSDVQATPTTSDGDSVSIWFEARDFRGNSPVYEKVLVHIDSSPPLLRGLGLRKTGINELLYLYGSSNLLELDIVFEAQDIHSGLYELEWSIVTTGNVLVANGDISITNYERDACIIDLNCICDSIGHCHSISWSIPLTSSNFITSSQASHDTDYLIIVTATNHAQLSSTLTAQFTVDLTPPLVGVVFDGRDISDIDYTTSYNLNFHWSGFFDRETDILIYQYIISTQCASKDSFQYPDMGMSLAMESNITSVDTTVSTTGKYHITVVAYNKAYQPTDPLCSDGIIIDITPPTFRGVVILGGMVKEGLIRLASGEVWLVNSERKRILISGSFNETCINQSTLINQQLLSTIPLGNNRSSISSDSCHLHVPFTDITYTSIDYLLNFTWSVTDDNGIHDNQFAMTTNNFDSPDLIPFQSTVGHAHFSAFSEKLINGRSFHVLVKSIDLVGHETSISVGPIIIDVTPPVKNGSVSITALNSGRGYLVSWDDDGFYDNEDVNTLNYQYAIGRAPYGTDVLGFTPLSSLSTPLCSTPYCIVIATDELEPDNEYYVMLQVINSANLATFVSLDPFTIPYPLSSINCITIFDFSSNDNPFICGAYRCVFSPQQEDLDIILNTRSISVGWKGLEWSRLNVSFAVAMGTRAGLDDVFPFTFTGSNLNYYTFTDTSLTYGQRYYTSVRAYNDHDTITASSDGFIALPSGEYFNNEAFIWDGLSDDYNINYQLSASTVSAHWYYPISLSRYLSYYEWALFRITPADERQIVISYTSTGINKYIVYSFLNLELNTRYVSSVRGCFGAGHCLEPRYSDGFYLATPPNSSNLMAEYYDKESLYSSGRLIAKWVWFQDPELQYYEWAIGSDKNGRSLLTPWTRTSTNNLNITLDLDTSKAYQSSYYFTLRGINKAGLVTSISALLSLTAVTPLPVVYDVSSLQVTPVNEQDWRNIEHTYRDYFDLDYTNSSSSLSAAWPNLKYTTYSYSISTSRSYVSCDREPHPFYCNTTLGNSVTVTGLELAHGVKYYFCVRGLAQDMSIPSNSPQTITACSNGIIVDLAPPTGGCVHIVPQLSVNKLPVLTSGERGVSGSGEEAEFSFIGPHSCVNQSGSQSSVSELHIVWESFTDIGIRNYEYSLGTYIGGSDIVEFTSVGVVNDVIVTGLSLKSGLTYYATIRATDYTGQQSSITSQGMTIDLSPPTIGRVWLNTPNTYIIKSFNELKPNWDLVIDHESQITSLYWSIGSSAGSGDIIYWTNATNVSSTSGSVINDSSAVLVDGQPLVLTLMAVNSAGLSSIRSSRRVLYDTTPPCPARVFDGPHPSNGYLDLDYTSNHTHISAHWGPFSDPHTGVHEYWWAIGSCTGCTDVMGFVNIGLTTVATRRINLSHGRKYYVSVRGCGYYSGCTVAHSDGITIDVTGPITSLLHHGVSGQSLQFQASRYTLSCHWGGYPGFHDSQSKLSHFIYSAGTTPTDHAYIPPTILPGTATSFIAHSPFSSTHLLPINRTVYVTLQVYNRAGLSHSVTSKGVFITDKGPQIIQGPFINTTWGGSLVNGTQYTNSLLKVHYTFTDTYTSVNQYFWYLYTPLTTYRPIPPSHTYNSLSSTHTNTYIQDGTRLGVSVIGCNQPGICNTSISTGVSVLIDSSPPIDGYFALKTTSSASLSWAINDGMIWRNDGSYSLLNFTFTGFSDPHSGISQYWVTIGSGYGKGDLFKSILSNIRSHPVNDLVSMAMLQLPRPLEINETIFIWLWALNGVGRESNIVQGTFIVRGDDSDDGRLELLRSQSCPIVSCVGHCTCSQRGHLCELPANSTLTCNEIDLSSLSRDMRVTVTSLLPQGTRDDSPDFIVNINKLSGEISHMTESADFQWVEWSVSEINRTPGSGLIDVSLDPVWFPLGLSNAIFDVSSSLPLQQGRTYVFRARVWYNSTHFANFISQGVLVDSLINPTNSQGFQLKEISSFSNSLDIDYSIHTNFILLKWEHVFNTMLSGGYLNFEIGLGDNPGADNIFKLTSIGTNITQYNLTSLSLKGNRKYYSLIRGVTPTNIVLTSISDGFTVDLTPPKSGVVFIGGHYHSNSAQSNMTSVSLRLLGFHDPESFIANFKIGIKTPYSEVSSYIDIGINLAPVLSNLNLIDGQVYIAEVLAYNSAGGVIQVISSLLSIDISDPVIVKKNCSTMHIDGFEHNSSSSFNATPYLENGGWDVDGYGTVINSDTIVDICNDEFIPFPNGGNRAVQIPHSITRTETVTSGTTVCVSLDVLATQEKKLIMVCFGCSSPCGDINCYCHSVPITCTSDCCWKEKLQWTYTSTSSSLTISICPDNSIIDNVLIESCLLNTPKSSNVFEITPPFDSSLPLSLMLPLSDTGSQIKNIQYAIGTIRGGEQITSYTLISPTDITIYPYNIYIPHNTSLYLSVAVWDFAGNSKVFYSNEFLIDRTPPHGVGDGVKEIDSLQGDDVDYIGSSFIWIDWSNIVDEESGIKHCQWAIGTTPGGRDIINYSTLSYDTSANTSDLSSLVSHGTKLYSTVSCYNNAGLHVTVTSDGVTLLYDPPTHRIASLLVQSPIPDQWYESESGYLSTDSIQFNWNGFQYETLSSPPPFHYQFRIIKSGSVLGSEEGWCEVGNIQQLIISSLNLTINVEHLGQVRAYVVPSLTSQPMSASFVIVPSPPVWNKDIQLNVTWSTNQMAIEWNSAFHSLSPLTYEISLGYHRGGTSIRRWVVPVRETEGEKVTFIDSRLSRDQNYVLTLNAIGYNGLSTVATYSIDNNDVVPILTE